MISTPATYRTSAPPVSLRLAGIVLVVLMIILSSGSVRAQSSPRLPLVFIENRGQWDEDARYLFNRGNLRAWFTGEGVLYDLKGRDGTGHVLRQRFTGARAGRPSGQMRQEAAWSFIGGGRSISAEGFAEVRYRSMYDGIDARYYEHEGGLKYDILVAPGADPAQVRFTYDGAASLALQPDGSLRIGTSVGDLIEAAPYCYQEIDGKIHPVPCTFMLDGRVVGFNPGRHDPSRPLVIDPALIYSSYLGGGGADEGRGITLDDRGNIYVTGSTRSENFPTTPGAYRDEVDPVNPAAPSEDIFVAKFDPTGSTLIYGTYINGRSNDRPAGIVVQSNGVAVIAGTTSSVDFETTPGAFDRSQAGVIDGKGFLLGLSSSGRSLVFSTYFGGSDADAIEALALGRNDHIYIAGWTRSRDLPTTVGVLAESFRGGAEDGFIARFNETGALRFSTYLGGTADERISSIIVETGGRAWVTGWTTSPDFPTDTLFSSSGRSARDCFMTCLLPELTRVFAGMMIGGAGDDEGRSIAVRERFGINPLSDTIYVTGRTTSANYPIVPGTLTGPRGSWLAAKVIVSSVPPVLVYSRYLGTQDDGVGAGIQADFQGRAYIAGSVRSPGGDMDIRLIQLNPTGEILHERQIEEASADDTVARQSYLSNFGDLFITGTTRSSDLPTGVGAFDTRLNNVGEPGANDAFIIRYGFLRRPAIYAPPLISFDTVRCAGERLDTFLVRNLGEETLVISNHNLISDGDSYSILEPYFDTVARIPAGGSMRYIVRYTPRRAGIDTAKLQIVSNDLLPGHNPLEVRFSAVHILIDPRPGRISFGSAFVCGEGGGSEVKRTLDLIVTPAVRTQVRLQLRGTSGAFRFAGPSNFEVNSTAQITLSFVPPSPGLHRDTLLILHADCPDTLRVPLDGTGQAIQVSLAEQELRFPPLFACSDTVDHVDTTFTVVNNGSLPITIEGLAQLDPGFSLITPMPLQVPPNSTAKITLRFTRGSGNEPVVGYAFVRVRECSRPLSLPLLGEIKGAGSLRALLEVNFSEVVGCPDEPTRRDTLVLLANTGEERVTIDTVMIIGDSDPSGFELGDISQVPRTLDPSTTAALPVDFAPADTGVAGATLIVVYRSGNCQDTVRVRLVGRHAVELVEAADTVIDIPVLSECVTGHDTLIVLRNRSGRPVRLTRVPLTEGIDTSRALTTPIIIPPDGVIVDTVGFAPKSGGAAEERITYITEICRDSITVTLRGSRRGVALGFTRDSLVLSPVPACRTVPILDTLVLRNTGDAGAIATIVSMEVLGDNRFALAENPAGRTIQSGDELRIPLLFTPSGAGIHDAMLRVVFEPCDDTIMFPLKAVVIEPDLDIRGGKFGEVQVGSSATERVVVVNDNPFTVTLDRIDGLVPPFSISGGDDLPATLAPGDSLELLVEFAPLSATTFAPTPLIVAADSCPFVVPVTLEGIGISVADTLSFCLEEFISGRAGDTVELRLQPSHAVLLPADIRYYLLYDRSRLEFIDASAAGAKLQSNAGVPGSVSFIQPAGDVTGEVMVRFRLLAGRDNPVMVHIDSIDILSDTLIVQPCGDSTRVFISDGCLFTGVQLGAFKNRLEDARPNPAENWVELTYQQLEDAVAAVRVFDALGREVLRPFEGMMRGGRYTIRFSVATLPAGSYLYRIDAGSYSETRQLIVNR